MASVFISYSTRNATEAHAVRDGLRKAGVEYWMAPDCIAPGEDYSEALSAAIRNCDRVVVLVSRASNASRYVRREIERAVSHNKPIIPVLLEDFELQGGLEFLISSAQFLDGTPTDPAAWVDTVVTAAQSGAGEPLKPDRARRGFFTVDASMLALSAAGAAMFVALLVSLVSGAAGGSADPLGDATGFSASPVWIAAGFAVLAMVTLAGRRLQSRRGRRWVIRVGDVLALTALVIGLVLFGAVFLMTPLVAVLLVGLLYLPLRNLLVRRWGVLALSLLLALGSAIWFLEGQLYRRILDGGQTVAVVPKCEEIGCAEDGRALYVTLITELNRLLRGDGPTILPTDRSSSYTGYFENASDFVHRPVRAHRMNLLSNWRDFDSLAFVSLEPAFCGEPKLHFTIEAAPVRRSAPVWSSWRLGRSTSLAGANEVRGFLPLDDDASAALLLAGLILQHVMDIGTSDPDLLKQYLRTARDYAARPQLQDLPPDMQQQLASQTFETADPDAILALFQAVVAAFNTHATQEQDQSLCETDATNAVAQFVLRNSSAESWRREND